MSKLDGRWWDEAWSLVEGCTQLSEACTNCWAMQATAMRSNQSNAKIVARYEGLTEDRRFNGRVRLMEADLDKPRRRRKPTIFSVWNDLFHPSVPVDFIEAAFRVMRECERHYFLVCTKRPERAWEILRTLRVVPLPKNYGLGTTVESDRHLDRLDALCQAPAPMRFVSCEPLFTTLNLQPYLGNRISVNGRALSPYIDSFELSPGIDWVIVGCESGRGARHTPHEYFRDIVEDCLRTDVPVWVKQLQPEAHWTHDYPFQPATHDMRRFPEEFQLREWPRPLAEVLANRGEAA